MYANTLKTYEIAKFLQRHKLTKPKQEDII